MSGTRVCEVNVLVGFFDLTQFARFSREHTNREVFDLLQQYFELVGQIVSAGGGTVVKFIGDAGLVVFPEKSVNSGVLALKRLKDEGDRWLADRGVPCRNVVKGHFGPVVCGPLGTLEDKRFDIIGETVNIAALLQTDGLGMSAQVFRKLDKDVRKHFKKHTPPITYIPVDQRHRN
jgi:class 3 adenylate cyclase